MGNTRLYLLCNDYIKSKGLEHEPKDNTHRTDTHVCVRGVYNTQPHELTHVYEGL